MRDEPHRVRRRPASPHAAGRADGDAEQRGQEDEPPSASSCPPGMVQCRLYVGFSTSRRPRSSNNSAPAEAGTRGTFHVGSLIPIMLSHHCRRFGVRRRPRARSGPALASRWRRRPATRRCSKAAYERVRPERTPVTTSAHGLSGVPPYGPLTRRRTVSATAGRLQLARLPPHYCGHGSSARRRSPRRCHGTGGATGRASRARQGHRLPMATGGLRRHASRSR